jgi:hypothetical protein
MHAILNGAWRFALVSVLAFGFWAVQSKILPKSFGEPATFVGCLIAFVVFAEIFLVPLAHQPNARRKFNESFIPAFIAYAVVWSACWFGLHLHAREWIGSALGCAAFASILYWRLGAQRGLCKAILFLIVTHSAGYYLGGKVFYMARHPPPFAASWSKETIWSVAKLMWGLCYGLGFGAGIGYAFDRFQRVAPAKQP